MLIAQPAFRPHFFRLFNYFIGYLYVVVAYVNLGTSLMADGRLAEAASALRAGSRAEGMRVRDRREHDAARVSALVQLAALHSQRSHWHKALSAYKEALQILPRANTPIVGWTRHVRMIYFWIYCLFFC